MVKKILLDKIYCVYDSHNIPDNIFSICEFEIRVHSSIIISIPDSGSVHKFEIIVQIPMILLLLTERNAKEESSSSIF